MFFFCLLSRPVDKNRPDNLSVCVGIISIMDACFSLVFLEWRPSAALLISLLVESVFCVNYRDKIVVLF